VTSWVCGFRAGQPAAKSARRARQDFRHQTKAGIFRAMIRAFLPHLILAAIDFRYTKPHVT
jgi:hypothetical protein